MARKRFDVLKEIAAHIESTALDGVSAHLAIDEARTKFSRLITQLESAAGDRVSELHNSPFWPKLMAIKADMEAKRYGQIPSQCRALAAAAEAHGA